MKLIEEIVVFIIVKIFPPISIILGFLVMRYIKSKQKSKK